jgi:Zn-finger domain-containing protein
MQALPAVEYNKDPRDWELRRVLPDIALLALVLMYTVMTVLDFYWTLRVQFKFEELAEDDVQVME